MSFRGNIAKGNPNRIRRMSLVSGVVNPVERHQAFTPARLKKDLLVLLDLQKYGEKKKARIIAKNRRKTGSHATHHQSANLRYETKL